MAVWSFIEFNTPDTQILSDLQGVAGDLQAVEEVCKAFLNLQQDTEYENILIRESLCAMAIIRYGRSFSTGVRQWDQVGVISKLENRLNITHSYFLELRNKWIAHSVNAFEENSVQIYLTPAERGPKGISSITVAQNRVVCLSGADMAALSELAKVVRTEVEKTP